MQSPLLQEGRADTGQNVRIVTIDMDTGETQEYAEHLDSLNTTVIEILASTNQQTAVRRPDR